MPYININDPKLPSYIKKLPSNVRKKWVVVFNSVFSKEGEKTAFIIANGMLDKWLVKRSKHVKKQKKLLFEKAKRSLVKRSDGFYTIDFVLTDILRDSTGLRMSLPLLEKWAEQLNSTIQIFGDTDHEEFDIVADSDLSSDEAIRVLRNSKKGFAKSIKAFIEKGKLWIRALVDPRARDIVNKAKGISLEADLEIDVRTNTAVDGELGGFTFATKSNPINPRAQIKK